MDIHIHVHLHLHGLRCCENVWHDDAMINAFELSLFMRTKYRNTQRRKAWQIMQLLGVFDEEIIGNI